MTYALECFTLSPENYHSYPSFSDPQRSFLSNQLTNEEKKYIKNCLNPKVIEEIKTHLSRLIKEDSSFIYANEEYEEKNALNRVYDVDNPQANEYYQNGSFKRNKNSYLHQEVELTVGEKITKSLEKINDLNKKLRNIDLEKQETARILEFKKQQIEQAKVELEVERVKQIELLDEQKKQEHQENQRKLNELQTKKEELRQQISQFKEQLKESQAKEKEFEKIEHVR
jgi:hypothetical protein